PSLLAVHPPTTTTSQPSLSLFPQTPGSAPTPTKLPTSPQPARTWCDFRPNRYGFFVFKYVHLGFFWFKYMVVVLVLLYGMCSIFGCSEGIERSQGRENGLWCDL
ncbi:unnamed protein product, partial [Prunus brigantina]